MRLYKLLDNLYFSGYPDKETIAREGFDVIFTICKKMPIDCDATVVHIPISDGKKLPENAKDVADLVVESCRSGHKTLVHCYLGRNRSALVAALAYVELAPASKQEAFELIKSLRPNAFYNNTFEEYLNS